MPVTEKAKVYARAQEALRKDVERAFGRLHSKWHILKYPGMANKVEHLNEIWECCIILHNMTLKDEKTKRLERTDVTEYPASLGFLEPGECQPLKDAAYFAEHSMATDIEKRSHMENSGFSQIKQTPLVEHVFKHSKRGV